MVSRIETHSVRGPAAPPPFRPPAGPQGTGFASMLKGVIEGPREITFSAHAQHRLNSRNIQLNETDLAHIAKAVDEASAKGARESLLIMDGLALVVSVPNRTVITVLEPKSGENTVFTNIDSAVVMQSEESSSRKHNPIGLDPFGGSPRAADR